MDNSIWSILDIIFIGAGFYVLYAMFVMNKTGEIKTSVLLSKDTDIRKCKDIEGYKKYVSPKMIAFGIGSILYGAAGLVNTYVYTLPTLIYMAVMIVFFAVLIWYALATRKAAQIFW